MTSLLKHWFGTDRNSAIKSISAKPLWVTTRDAVIITALTLIVTLIITYFWYTWFGTPVDARDYLSVGVRTVATSIAAQYLYEYSGANNMLAESSLRYARGSTLAKYVSTREALLYECLYKLKESHLYDAAALDKNFAILRIVLTEPALVGAVGDYATGLVTAEALRAKYRAKKLAKYSAKQLVESDKKIAALETLLALPRDTLAALGIIADRVNQNIVCDILVNGPNDYRVTTATGITGTVGGLINAEILDERGAAVAANIEN
jgi:hypothetical protein